VAELNRKQRGRLLAAGALLAGSAVALGAFGAHGLAAALGPERIGWWRTGAQYQLAHGLALVALSAAPVARPGLPAILLGGGAALFSVSLYLMAVTDALWLGALAPVGGLAMIAGWALLAWRTWRDAGLP
jgi:uncharacterized membrane protein YgdD (TMEM256/DUF423 family)